jgi:hypothetical protein
MIAADDRRLAIENALKTPKRGQGAECPDRIFTEMRFISSSNFLGVTPAPFNTPLT